MKQYDQVSAIIAYEQGEMDDEGTLELFQHLVDTGMAWKLQGSYGRMAAALLDRGAINPAPAAVRAERDKALMGIINSAGGKN